MPTSGNWATADEIVWCDERVSDMSRETLVSFVEQLNYRVSVLTRAIEEGKTRDEIMARACGRL